MYARMSRTVFYVVMLVFTMQIMAVRSSVLAQKPLPYNRETSVTIIYEKQHVYGGRLDNAKAAFARLTTFFDADPFVRAVAPTGTEPHRTELARQPFSFLRDVLRSSMLPKQGFVVTQFGFGYGACGAPSLLHELVNTAMFKDADGEEKSVFEPLAWVRERNPTYGRYGVAIYLDPDLAGKRTKDYRWRLNPAYDGPPPRITITFSDDVATLPGGAQATMTMRYGDE
jgi:hypothetical protein